MGENSLKTGENSIKQKHQKLKEVHTMFSIFKESCTQNMKKIHSSGAMQKTCLEIKQLQKFRILYKNNYF